MKRILCLVFALALISTIIFVPTASTAEIYDIYGDLQYIKYDDHIEIAHYIGSDSSVDIPGEIDGLPVTSIGDTAFKYCYSLTNINLPDSVTRVGNAAFEDCQALTGINLHSGVAYIGDMAFSNCYSLTDITLPNTVTYIGDSAFNLCASLTDINIPNGVTFIGDMAFLSCGNLTDIFIPRSVTFIGKMAFYYCEKLANITVDNNNPNYSSLNGSLFNKYKTTLIKYSDSKNVVSYTIPDSVKSIEAGAFDMCPNLMRVAIPDSVTEIGDGAFDYCISLTDIIVDENNKHYSSLDGNLFNKDKTKLIQYAVGKSDSSYTIPNSVTYIETSAFAYGVNLTDITIPAGVTYIGYWAFGSCVGLTDINIPDGVTYIGERAFDRCMSLIDITIPDGVRSIGELTFYMCTGLTDITITDGLTYIGNGAFSGCENLADVYYVGNSEQWNNINIGSGNQSLTGAKIHFNSPRPDPGPTLAPTAKPTSEPTPIPTPTQGPEEEPSAEPTFVSTAEPSTPPADSGIYMIDAVTATDGGVIVKLRNVSGIGGKVIAASYTSDGVLVDIEQIDVSLAAGETGNITLHLNNADHVKAFVWNSFDGMMPLAECAEHVI